LLSTAVVVDMVVVAAVAVERTPADSAAAVMLVGLVEVMPVGLAAPAGADSAVAVRLALQAGTRWWAAHGALDTSADRTTLLALDTQQDFAGATLAGASPMHTDT
jgi:hypothetical protein